MAEIQRWFIRGVSIVCVANLLFMLVFPDKLDITVLLVDIMMIGAGINAEWKRYLENSYNK